ncbi:MAG TPA: DedA family protein [Candidatus Paceibacterota bacterium]
MITETAALILAYKYYIIFPLAVFEGPILAAVAGFFITTGYLNFIPVYLIVILGDVIGDLLMYGLGRFGRKILLGRVGRIFKITEEKLEQAKEYFNLHQKKAIVFSKLVHGIGAAGLIAAGSLKISYWRFMKICLIVSFFQSAFLIGLGVLFGKAYIQLGEYLNYYSSASIVIAIAVLIFFIFKRLKFKIKP